MSAHPFYFSGDPYLSVMKGIYQALSTAEPFIKLVGAEKTGKTTLCEKLTLFMRKKGRRVIFFDCVIQSPEELRLVLIKELRLPDSHNFSRQLEQFLPSSDSERITVIFDNVDQYSITTLLDVARLAEIQGDSRRVLNIVIAGNSALNQRLSSNADFTGVKQQISHSFTLGPMRQDALSLFYMDYFSKADMEEVHLEAPALALALRATGGLPGPASQLGKAIAESRVGMQELTAVSRLELVGFLKTLSLESGLRVNASALLDGQGRVYLPVFVVLFLLTIAFVFSRTGEPQQLPQTNAPEVPVESPTRRESDSQANSGSLVDEVDRATAEMVNEVVEPAENLLGTRSSPFADENSGRENLPAIQVSPPILSLDDQRGPVSDSGLSLVTAAERGIDADQIVTPVFEDFIADQEEALAKLSAASTEPLLAMEEMVDGDDLAELPEDPDQADIDPPLLAEATDAVDQAIGQAGDLPDPEVSTPADENLQAATSTTSLPSNQDPKSIAEDDGGELSAEEEGGLSEPAMPSVELEPGELAREYADSWVAAWESQDIQGYLGAYHSDFRPRYFDTQAEWRQTRERNIARPNWIRLGLTELEVTEASATEVEMVFWLSYESPTYADRTRKRIVMRSQDEAWLIVEEVNLEVRK